MTALTEFLFPAPAPRRAAAIIRWWEARRLAYNAIVGTSGLLSLGAMRLLTWLPPDARTMPADFTPVLIFGVLANVCYLLGPAVEIGITKLWGRQVLPAGPTLFRMGLTFSVGLTMLPTLITGLDWLYRILHSLL